MNLKWTSGLIRRFRQADQSGQAAMELALITPLIVLLIAGIILIVQLAYTHLALITMANDCVTSAVHGDSFEGFRAEEFTEHSFDSPRIFPGMAMGGESIGCSVAVILGGSQDWSAKVNYSFSLPIQPYKSDWEDAP